MQTAISGLPLAPPAWKPAILCHVTRKFAEIDLAFLERSPQRRGRPLPYPAPEQIATARRTGAVRPLIVRPVARGTFEAYEILDGEDSWMLAQAAGIALVPAYIRHDLSDAQAQALTAQMPAGDPDPMRRAAALDDLLQPAQGPRKTKAALARELGCSRTALSHHLRLRHLDPQVQAWIQRGELAAGHGRALASLPAEAQRALAARALRQRPRASVRAVERWARASRQGHPVHGEEIRPSCTNPPPEDPDLARLERSLGEHIGSPVRIAFDGRTGQGTLQVQFADLEVLEGVLEKLGYQR
ncbi:MAG: hypothetical protein B7Z66_15515 [Chromatiales bacterium 21-64-14]|nr:MAG: hypothetical protein B7Z66_15515 [Chromatiales bacterium 21-64-14]